VKATGRV